MDSFSPAGHARNGSARSPRRVASSCREALVSVAVFPLSRGRQHQVSKNEKLSHAKAEMTRCLRGRLRRPLVTLDVFMYTNLSLKIICSHTWMDGRHCSEI